MKSKIFILSLFICQFLIVNAQSWLWGENALGDGAVTSVASDINGNCYMLGGFAHDTIYFGSYEITNPVPSWSGLTDLFLVKFDHDGNVLWAKQTHDLDTDRTAGISTDGNVYTDLSGNVYIASDISDTLIIDSDTLVNTKGFDASYVIKFDPSGNIKWVEHSGCKNDSSGVGNEFVTSDIHGNVFLSGVLFGTVNFGIDTMVSSSSIYANAFLVKFDSNGNVKWAKSTPGLNSNSNDVSNSNTNDNFGNSFITGGFVDKVKFGSDTLFSNNTGNFYLAKYDPNGNVLWVKQDISLSGNSVGWSLVADPIGNVYAAGDFKGKVIFDKDTLSSPTYQSFFLIKYSPNGEVLWAKQAEVLDNNIWTVYGLSIDNYKRLYLSANGGYNHCSIAFGGATLSMYDTAKYDGASVIFKLDSTGNTLCSSIIPAGTIGGAPNAIASDTSGRYVYFGVSVGTVAIFGSDTINPFSVPINNVYGQNFFPSVARWQACDTNIFSSVVQNNNSGMGVILYPNPSNGKAELGITNYELGMKYNLGVYDIFGRQIEIQSIISKQTTIDLNNQPDGVYFYRVFNEKEIPIGQGKIIIEK